MKRFIIPAALLAPAVVLAQTLGNIETLLKSVGKLIDITLPIVVAIGLLAFFWGLVKFIFSAGSEDARKDGQRLMIWGLVALFVMVSVWGLVRFIGDSLDIQQGQSITVPRVPGI